MNVKWVNAWSISSIIISIFPPTTFLTKKIDLNYLRKNRTLFVDLWCILFLLYQSVIFVAHPNLIFFSKMYPPYLILIWKNVLRKILKKNRRKNRNKIYILMYYTELWIFALKMVLEQVRLYLHIVFLFIFFPSLKFSFFMSWCYK